MKHTRAAKVKNVIILPANRHFIKKYKENPYKENVDKYCVLFGQCKKKRNNKNKVGIREKGGEIIEEKNISWSNGNHAEFHKKTRKLKKKKYCTTLNY